MLLHRPLLSMRGVAVSFSVPVLLVGVLRSNALPARNKNFVPVPNADKTRSGEQIYAQMCASCHGAGGEGGKGYKKPLTGDQSIGQLARFIAAEMPPDADKNLPAPDAQKVAAYIHGAFYSSLAQARIKPARIELSRLTVRQYRNAVTDLIGSFRTSEKLSAERGLRAKYFETGLYDKPILERVDNEIRFDFGATGALTTQNDPYQFSMQWQGSVLAPDTGEYEFVVRTDQAGTLWINDLEKPLIDAQVKSGDGNEYRASIFLIGGRLYPLRLEFFKGVAGVNDLKKLKEKPPQKASLSLEWKMPKRADEVIPQRCLFPVNAAPVFVPATPFPPDDRSVGYERGTSISKEWDEATTEAAFEVAGYVADHLRELSGVADDAAERDVKLREFCRRFVTRAFRRPLSDEQARFFVEKQFQNSPNTEIAVKRVVLLTLKSPRFLYREIDGATAPKIAANQAATVQQTALDSASPEAPNAYDVASRLSFALWDSLPDEELLKAAAAGELATREQVLRQAERLAADPRAWFKMREFLLQWLKLDQYPDLAKDQKQFVGFDESVASDLRTSLELTLEDVIWNDKSDLHELLTTDKFFLNGRLARVYGEALPRNAPFQKVAMNYGRRAGVLTHPYLLASFAYLDTSSPIHRGVLIARSVLGRMLQAPPAAFTPIPASLHPNLTTRERVSLQTKPAACISCHNLINPLGFSLEKFDAIGGLRAKENGLPVNASGGYRSRSGEEVKFSGARDLANFLAGSSEVHAAFVEKLFHHTAKQPIKAYGVQALPNLLATFRANNFNVRRQMIESAVLAALGSRDDKMEAAGQSVPKKPTKT